MQPCNRFVFIPDLPSCSPIFISKNFPKEMTNLSSVIQHSLCHHNPHLQVCHHEPWATNKRLRRLWAPALLCVADGTLFADSCPRSAVKSGIARRYFHLHTSLTGPGCESATKMSSLSSCVSGVTLAIHTRRGCTDNCIPGANVAARRATRVATATSTMR